ncbi:MAG: hypothetical protein AAFQ20_11135, partial [Bacteroidota bacterium]
MLLLELIRVYSANQKFRKKLVCFLLITSFFLSSCTTQRAIRLRNKSLDAWQQPDSVEKQLNHLIKAFKE